MVEEGMKYAADTELNSFGGELISFALVPLHGEHQPLYVVLEHDHMDLHPWVKENVIPKLGDQKPVSREVAARMLAAFLRRDSDPIVYADWPQDLSELMMLAMIGPGMMVNTPAVSYRYEPCQGFNAADESKMPHNALHDAMALKQFMLDIGL
jgi:hypothetical protein